LSDNIGRIQTKKEKEELTHITGSISIDKVAFARVRHAQVVPNFMHLCGDETCCVVAVYRFGICSVCIRERSSKVSPSRQHVHDMVELDQPIVVIIFDVVIDKRFNTSSPDIDRIVRYSNFDSATCNTVRWILGWYKVEFVSAAGCELGYLFKKSM
jgi:hypothetical protein